MKNLVTGIVFVFFACVSLAHADFQSDSQSDAKNREIGHQVSVQGVARFEERHTIVPVGFCEADHECFSSQIYWSLLIESDSEKFEVDQRFNEGQGTPPETIELDGFLVRVGSVIRLDATIEDGSNDYYFIGHVRDVNGTGNTQDLAQPSLPNWTCRGSYNPNIQIQADVWAVSKSDINTPHRYGMRVIGMEQTGSGEKRTYSVANLLDGSANITRDGMIYEGQSNESINGSAVRLAVALSQAVNSVPGELKVSVQKALLSDFIPGNLDLSVSCSRSR